MRRLRPHSVRNVGGPAPWAPETVGSISELIEYTDVVDNAASVLIGTIPAGARYLMADIKVITAFNSGGADDAIVVGIVGDTDYLIEKGHPDVADSVTEGELLDWTPTADQLIYATHSSSGTAPTTGKAIVTVRFKQPL